MTIPSELEVSLSRTFLRIRKDRYLSPFQLLDPCNRAGNSTCTPLMVSRPLGPLQQGLMCTMDPRRQRLRFRAEAPSFRRQPLGSSLRRGWISVRLILSALQLRTTNSRGLPPRMAPTVARCRSPPQTGRPVPVEALPRPRRLASDLHCGPPPHPTPLR